MYRLIDLDMLLMLYFSRCDEVNICMYIATVIFVCYLKLNAVFHGLAANTVLRCLQGAGESRRFSSVERSDIEGNHFLEGIAQFNNR